MRYKSWDVLLFPDKSKVPLQEFKTQCHVVQDNSLECAPLRNNGLVLIPTVTAFIPAIRPGQPFRMSIHSWETPGPSQFLKDYSKHADQVIFEARVFVDGRVAGFRYFGRDGPWPVIIENGLTIDKNGDVELLPFPPFHKELLTQNYWNAGDELGRIRVVISEGFPRDSHITPYERCKSLVAFSFQHAPVDVLEASAIAWPNAAMWRSVSFGPGTLPPAVPSYRQPSEPGVDVHSHSPRRRSGSRTGSTLPPPHMGMLPPAIPSVPRAPLYDPFVDNRGPVWRQASASSAGASLDVSMPDYSSSSGMSQANQSRRVTDGTAAGRDRFQSLQSHGAVDSLCEALRSVRDSRSESHENTADTTGETINTPSTNEAATTSAEASSARASSSKKDSAETSEAVHEDEDEPRLSLFSLTSSAGNKRQRVVSGSARVGDAEEETKIAPLIRTESLTLLQENKENKENN